MVELLAVSERPLPLVIADRVATGAPVATPVIPNCALVVATPPTKKSWVVIRSLIAPLFCSNGDPPLITGRIPEISVPPFKFTRPVESVPLAEVWTMPRLLSADKMVVPFMVVVAPACEIAMLPVVGVPMVKVCLLLVPKTPVAVSEVAPVEPEIEAVGVPPPTLVKANFALVVALLPSNKSWVPIRSKILPFA